MTRSNELGMPIWLSTSRFAPPTEILRTKQSIPEPSNEIVPAIMTFWRWVPRLWSIRPPLCQSVQNFPKLGHSHSMMVAYDHDYSIRRSSAFQKITTASPPTKAASTLVGKVLLSTSSQHLCASLKPIDTTCFRRIKVLRCNNAVKRDAYHATEKPRKIYRTNVRYIRRRRNRLVYRRLAKAAALLVIAALIVFA